jgi:limonene-1,2-epoxide hydrolase
VSESSDDALAPVEVVTRFLSALQEGDVDTASELVAPDLVCTNVSLATLRGKERFTRFARAYYGHHLGFRVVVHHFAGDGSMVLNERTDTFVWGRFQPKFWVCGVFVVDHGQITLWRDYFDWGDSAMAILKGLIGMVFRPATAES